MARKVQMDTSYIFTPSANRITIDKAIPQEKLLLITNLSSNTVIYNFSDPNLRVASYTRTRDSQIAVTGTPGTTSVTNLWPSVTPVVGQRITGYGIPANTFISAVAGTSLTLSNAITADPYTNQNTPTSIFGTIIILNANTSSMNVSDKLQIFVDEYEETIRPAEVLLDPVSKQRVSTAQALIDTDFEYGLQTTKWESLQLISNRPSYYYVPTTPIGAFDVTQTSTSRTTTVRARVALTGTVTTAANTTVNGTNTRFTSELKPGSLLFSNTGAFIGAIATVASDTSATLKANGLVAQGPIAMFATGQRFADNGAPGTGIFAGSGTLTVGTGSAAVTGQSSKFASELTIGDRLFDPSGALIGTIATVVNDLSATLTAPAAVNATTAAFEVSQYTPGKPIFTQYLTNTDANGSFLINGPTTGTLAQHVDFTYDMEAVATTTGSIFDISNTNLYPGYFYAGQQIGGTTQATFGTDNSNPNSTITVTVGSPHNLQPGAPIFVVNTNTTAANGNWYVARVPSPTTFEYVTQAQVGAPPSGGQVYVRPLGGTLHRPFDGGLRISCATNSPNAQLIRQTRRYFRYQSGKGLQFSTGTILKPSISVDSLVSNGTSVLVTCKESHYLYPGATISISGAIAANGTFNGTYVVATDGLTNNQFRYIPSSVPTNTTQATGFPINLSVTSWSNASTRIGMFDMQNGFHFKYDGSVLSVVRRSSVDQLSGTIRVTTGSSSVEGINTQFNTQLRPGNMVVIRGQSYLVTSISAASGAAAMTISPEYRGTTISSPSSAYISKTIDYEIPQTDWNIDKCDGTGPSGFNVDTSRMQMLYIDYSWYGAGAIRYGFKDQRGEVIYVHRIANANNKTEAFMRSGNMPARYETNTIPVSTTLQSTLASGTGGGGIISVADTTGFPTTGYVWIQAPTGAPELISYSSKTNTSFTIAARATAGGQFFNCTTTVGSNIVTNASTFATLVQPYMHVHGSGIPVGTFVVGISTTTVYLSNPATATSSTATLVFKAAGATAGTQYNYSATTPIAVYSYGPQFAPNISHWGSSVIMDGRYDDDKSLIFTAGMQSSINVSNAAGSNVVALISIRVGPSVDSGVTGLLGVKELLNRMQLTLASAGISADGRFLIDVRLNGQVSGGTWQNLGGSSLAQVCYHAAGTSISGGESIASLYTNTAGGAQYTVTTVDLAKARDLGNSILGGGTTLNASSGYFPDGPDMLTLVARNIDSASKNIIARISWTEAQA
jgi:hypothetical protein